MRYKNLIAILFILLSTNLFSTDFYLRANQMFGIELGIDFPLGDWGLRSSLGGSVISLKPVNYSLTAYYKILEDIHSWDFYIEGGLPLGYFDLWENRYVDWDDIIDSPYAGWLLGLSLRSMYKKLGISAGASWMIEWKDGAGVRGGFIPLLSISYYF